MIDIDKCKKEFFNYIEKYDLSDPKINLKVIHSLKVLNVASNLAEYLKLDEENKNLSMLIALLHDIGRFEQVRVYDTLDDRKSIDHADLGVKILFEDALIRKFIDTNKYDEIIYAAIKNHNKYEIEDGLDELKLMHAKIIRDADKIDIFRVEFTEDMQTLLSASEIELAADYITDSVYNDFLEHRLIERSKISTKLDRWIASIAYIFDLNFKVSMKYLINESYIEKLFDRIEYSNCITEQKVKNLRKSALDYASGILAYS